MTYAEFIARDPHCVDGLSPALASLALDRAGEWAAAHDAAAQAESAATNRVHAYLHRKEGDLGNARYWYGRVGEPLFDGSLDEEWTALVRRFLQAA